ncbi:MAG: response regulator transcription factor [Firmicutes bacterium]|nr:response regulator transcription factor [Bacillota bacterium]
MLVLLVEDEVKLASVIKKGLENEGFTVDAVYDGAAAYERASCSEYDVIILDLMLPEMDGLTVCQRLREEGNRTPILMLTAKDEVTDKVMGLNAGADDYLTKPFSFDELIARLRALLRRGRDLKPENLVVADLVLDTSTHEAVRGGKRIQLSGTEYRILEYLMRHPNQVVTRGGIEEHVWGYDFVPNSNLVDVYIRYLRRKIDEGFERRLLETVRGEGYRLSAGPSSTTGTGAD